MPEVRTLTALRGIAALWVVLYHYNHHFAVDLGKIVRMGDLAVDVFFTLSGFIMVYVYGNRARFGSFMLKRVARLYPVHLATLCGVILMAVAAHGLGVASNTAISARAIVANLLGVHGWGVLDGLTLNYPSWSISAELAAYLLFPFAAKYLLRARLAHLVVGSAVFAVFCIWLADATGRPINLRSWDFSPLRILPEFVLGMTAARIGLETRIDRRLVLALATGGLTVAFWRELPLVFIATAPVLVLALFLWDGPLPRPLIYLGQISYSLYMVHALVEKAGFTMAERLIGSEKLPLGMLPVMIAAAVVAAMLLYHGVEEPGRRWIMRSRRSGPDPAAAMRR